MAHWCVGMCNCFHNDVEHYDISKSHILLHGNPVLYHREGGSTVSCLLNLESPPTGDREMHFSEPGVEVCHRIASSSMEVVIYRALRREREVLALDDAHYLVHVEWRVGRYCTLDDDCISEFDRPGWFNQQLRLVGPTSSYNQHTGTFNYLLYQLCTGTH